MQGQEALRQDFLAVTPRCPATMSESWGFKCQGRGAVVSAYLLILTVLERPDLHNSITFPHHNQLTN